MVMNIKNQVEDDDFDGEDYDRSIKINHLPPLAQATTAAIGSVLSNALVYPLDLVTTRMQTRSIKPINSRSKSSLTRSSQLSSVSSSFSTITNRSSSIKRKRKKNYRTIISSIRTILENEQSGIGAFYNGLIVDSTATFINSFIYFYVYSSIKKLVTNYHHQSRNRSSVSGDMVFRMKGESPKVYKRKQHMINGLEVTIEELVIGSFAGMVSKFVTCPLSNITIRLQTTASSSSRALVDQSQSRSRTPLQKPVRNTVRPNTFTPMPNERIVVKEDGGMNEEKIDSYFSKTMIINQMIENDTFNPPLSDPDLCTSSEESSSEEEEEDDDDDETLGGRTSRFMRILLKTIRSIYRDGGYRGFWSGYSKNFILTLNPSLSQYLTKVLEKVDKRRRLSNDNRGSVSKDGELLRVFLTSAIASSLSTILSYPLMLSKTLVQNHRRLKAVDKDDGCGMRKDEEGLRNRIKKFGLTSIYVGLEPKLLKVFIGQGVTMSVKNRLERLIIYLYLIKRRRNI
ncbi:mitochondrial carrier domain-containing protein [Phakopsora pachyrhizi]|uniref:Mitochondrial carrier domain-containing protein n=1 Tax=Phakopsora pachyrhizi TaxID=170000 RepID=A0AAV0BCE6_PHAPC|nr:mitochondrial carrier domain-containing protein [Phakopsora pachyrhizi]